MRHVSIDTPGDLLWFESAVTGVQRKCGEWNMRDRVKVGDFEMVECPGGCVKDEGEVKRKCGVEYYGGG